MAFTHAEVLVLGGGIGGCLTACLLHDAGLDVAIVDANGRVMQGASRWNEGKLHLGYTYCGTASLASAQLMQEGTGTFEEGLERVIGRAIPEGWYSQPVTYLVDSTSMVDADLLWSRHHAVARLLNEQRASIPGLGRHLGAGKPLLERITVGAAEALTRQTGFVAAWRSTERAISTFALADAIENTVLERGIPVLAGRVQGVRQAGDGWTVELAGNRLLAADTVVNCLWESRSLIDRTVRRSGEPVSIRYRRALFGHGITGLMDVAPTSRVLGRYGDVAVYPDGRACLTWYAHGLLGRTDDGVPPRIPAALRPGEDVASVLSDHLAGLGLDAALAGPVDRWTVGGGYVVAYGYGDIDRMDSPLHERHRPDVTELAPGYFSLDTGKLCLGPLLAQRAAEMVLARRGLEVALA